MKTSETQTSTHHQQSAKSERPFFGAGPEHAFFSAERAAPVPFFSAKASSPPALQPKEANSDGDQVNQETVEKAETLTMQPIPELASTNKQVQAHTEHPLLTLQRQLGNRAVTQMIQAKLTVGKRHDHYEQEADRVANTVMRMPDPLVQRQDEDKKAEMVQMQPLVEPISPLGQQQVDEKAEPLQTLQRQTVEEEKAEPLQTLQRQTVEEEKAEPLQTLQRQTVEEEKAEPLQTKGTDETTPAVRSNLESSIQSMRGGGQPMPDSTRTFFESRFGHDFSGVRLHTDANANGAAKQLNAEAFTIKQDVFFNSGRYEPQTIQGKWLLAHELTHTVQQAPQPLTSAPAAAAKVAGNPSDAIAQRQPFTISSIVSQVQGLGRDTILNWVADHAANIPGFTMLTVLLGRNPINNRPVERSGINLVRGLMGLVPSGDLIFRTLQETGMVDRAFAWLNTQVQQLNITWDGIKALFQQAWDAVSGDGFEGAFAKIRGIFSPTVQRVMNFAAAIVGKVIGFIKEAILQPVGQFVKEKVPGYKLLTVILGKDPVTGEPVERNATNFIGGFLEMIPGGQETFKNLQESGAIARATTWLEQQIKGLNLTWEGIKALFSQTWNVLAIADLTSPLKAFSKIQTIFSPPIQRLSSFAVGVGKKVLEFVFEGVLKLAGPFAGAIMGAVKQSGDVFAKIIQNPIGFAGNLIKAVRQGFQQFSSNILTHLKTGLMGWLFGALASAGIAIPQKFDLEGIVSLVLQVLGATYARLREVLVKLVGEKTVARIEQVFDFLVTIATKGLSAAWEKITEFAGTLGDMVIGAIKDWVVTKVVTAAITKLVSMFNPAGAIIQAIMSIYNTIAFFMERAQQIAMLVTAVTQSIGSIAAGAIGSAANFVELSMAKAIPVILGFLARFLGLGNVAEPIQKAIKTIQDKVWGAITKLANFIVSKAKALFAVGKETENKDNTSDEPIKVEHSFSMNDEGHTVYAEFQNGQLVLKMASSRLDVLKAAIIRAILTAKGMKKDKLANDLELTYESLKLIEEDIRAVPYQVKENRGQLQAALLKRISSIGTDLERLGKKHGIKSLIDIGHPSSYVKDDEIKPEHRGNWRDLFYGNWDSTATSFKTTQLLVLMAEAKDLKWKTDPLYGKLGAFVCRDKNNKWDAHLADSAIPNNIHLDHIEEVSTHWVKEGHNQIQDERKTWYNTTTNLQVIDQKHNLVKGGPKLQDSDFKVSKRFRGRGEF